MIRTKLTAHVALFNLAVVITLCGTLFTRTAWSLPESERALPHKLDRFLKKEEKLVRTGRIDPNASTFFRPSPNQHSRGTVLLIHGYKSGWDQGWRNIADNLNQKGFNVLGVRQANHGLLSKGPRFLGTALPRSSRYRDYFKQVDHAFDAATSLGDPIYVVGQSFGGTMATYLTLKHMERVSGLVAITPFFGLPGWRGAIERKLKDRIDGSQTKMQRLIKKLPEPGLNQLGVRLLRKANQLTFRIVERGGKRILSAVDHQASLEKTWAQRISDKVRNGALTHLYRASGYEGAVTIDHTLSLLRVRNDIHELAHSNFLDGLELYDLAPRMLFITTGRDSLVDNRLTEELFGTHSSATILEFPKRLNVTHSLLGGRGFWRWGGGNRYAANTVLPEVVTEFISKSSSTWTTGDSAQRYIDDGTFIKKQPTTRHAH